MLALLLVALAHDLAASFPRLKISDRVAIVVMRVLQSIVDLYIKLKSGGICSMVSSQALEFATMICLDSVTKIFLETDSQLCR